MLVLVSDDAKEYVRQHGGAVYVRPHSHRCCQGSITLLDATAGPAPEGDDAESVLTDGIAIRFSAEGSSRPDQLVIEVRGRLRRHLVAYWDGCAYRM